MDELLFFFDSYVVKNVKTGNCIETYKLAFYKATYHAESMDLKQNESNTTSQDTRTGKPPERLASVHKGLEPLHRSTNSFRTIEPQSSRGAAYLRNTVALMKGEEKRDFSKAEQFKLKRRCASIKAPSDHDIKTLEVRLFSAFTKTYKCRAINNK